VQIPGGQIFADSVSTGATIPNEKQAMQRVREELENLERRWYGIARFDTPTPNNFQWVSGQ
ncbi:MAG: hypothetical protein MUP31_07775, partial [Xanthomonadales bacterium]|nr:hypothetical protein [Xanthomonadales bacterium]